MRKESRYLLHVWCDSDREEAWRASLQDLARRETTYFPSIRALNDHLVDSLHARFLDRNGDDDEPPTDTHPDDEPPPEGSSS